MFISLQTRKSKYLRNLELGALPVAIVEIVRSCIFSLSYQLEKLKKLSSKNKYMV